MLSALASADAVTWLSICVEALVYAATLLAMGSILSILTLGRLPASEVQALRQLSVLCAIAVAPLYLLRLPLQASFLMGGTWQGATDPMMLAMVADSALGFSIALRLVGLGLICGILLPARFGRPLAAFGVAVVALSFVFRGHALEEPRLLLAALITLHLLGLAFWIGAFAPLYRLSTMNTGSVAGQVSHDFGRIAVWVVGGLALAGGATLWLLTGNVLNMLFTPYGQFFTLKLGAFLGIIGFAAWNKLRLTPALLRQEQGAGARMRMSIRTETALIALILLTTAALTTVSAPEITNQPISSDALVLTEEVQASVNQDRAAVSAPAK
ncbi:copper resistance D family protein [Roseobacter litoralis]|uniref:copper resistance D family protein n=1 Tax=Roseobacter litoralis TaxID=42443 RepID=UPI0024922837|nr:CopD family protein [Roseobacter litoralis]